MSGKPRRVCKSRSGHALYSAPPAGHYNQGKKPAADCWETTSREYTVRVKIEILNYHFFKYPDSCSQPCVTIHYPVSSKNNSLFSLLLHALKHRIFMNKDSRIYIAGHRGMVGSAIHRHLVREGYKQFITATSAELDLRQPGAVNDFFSRHKPDYVFLAAARVGGIHANSTYPAEFLYDNLMIQNSVIHASVEHEVKKLMFLGSSCIYPKFAEQPIREESLLSGYLEPTNEAYAIAKIAGIKLCQACNRQYGSNFISVMPTNLYGYCDNYHPENSHVLPALLRRFHEAQAQGKSEVTIWGSGKPLREFMFADDLASACYFLMLHYDNPELINVGTGEEITILDLARLIARVVGFTGTITFDSSRPDGTPRKLMDSARLHTLGFRHKTSLEEGIALTYADFLKHQQEYALK
jgi:GDP-L-fucose synthase